MPRVASTLLLVGGAIALVAWVVRPASSEPQPSTSAPPAVDAPAANQLSTIAAEADALRDRLDAAPPYRAPVRDPFTYGRSSVQPARSTPVPTTTAAPAASVPAPPALVAILVNDTPQGASRRAVFSTGDDVAIRGVGDSVGAWHVTAIDVDRVTIADAAGRSIDVPLH
jgi:hypothetical protein